MVASNLSREIPVQTNTWLQARTLNSLDRSEMESRSAPQFRRIELHSGEETPCLPEQVITEEILTRLPVKSLLKFRCVSKSWCSLIGSKRFIKAHLKKSTKSSKYAHHWIFLDYGKKEFKQCSLPFLFDKQFTVPIYNVVLGIDFERRWVSAVGCCNGLVCILVNWKRFILWNPTTKKFKKLPDLYNLIQVECGVIRILGFGFDELSDDYKVFGIVNRGNARGRIGMVYSLRSNSWKHIEETDHVSPYGGEGISMGMYVSGKLHWYDNKCNIVSFDLNRHVYGVVELPSYTKGALHSVGVVGGCLSTHFVHPNGDLDVWLMKKYGVKESWDKVVTVPCYGYLESPIPIPIPVAIAPNGEVLLIRNSRVVIYNPKCDVLGHPQITALDDGFVSVCSLGIYVESLASVAPDAQ